ncbi:PLP-dependent aminotransferase family protein [Massilia sp. TSP1-1-2]|uniref:MocR-like pyridoxine biosynthesis transcription factor PdxR n=1 Tax=Massilia sp. TSP1-1-2 TaxID=2804649 RepID=UPI003CF776AF
MDYKVLLTSFEHTQNMHAWPRQRIIHACLRAAIVNGSLAAGTRLLASRALATDLGIARNTVLYAYDQLATEGLILATPRGTVVAPLALPKTRSSAAAPASGAIARRMQGVRALPASGAEVGAFAPGVPALAAFPVPLWRRTLERAWRGVGEHELNYADVAGELSLREEISAYLGASRAVRCDAGQVFITNGTQSSLEICAATFADAGATAWIENPGYVGALGAFRAAQLRTIGIAVDAGGIAPTAHDWQQYKPKLIYTTPSHQYPTGTVLDMPRRLALLQQAKAAGALIIEDDYDSEFRYEGPPLPAMQGLTPDAPVIYLGTFSKTMFPALRTGFMVVPANLAAPLRAVLARMAPHGRVADQLALADFMRSGQFGMHLRRMRRLYLGRRDLLLAALARHAGEAVSVHGSSAGIHLSLQFNDAALVDADVTAAALEQGIVARALSAHATGLRQHGWNGLVLGYSQVDEAAMDERVKMLVRVMRASRR